MKIKYGKFLLNIVSVAVLTAIIASILNYIIGIVGGLNLGIFSGLVIAFIIASIFVWSTKIRYGTESLTEAIPIIVISLALVEFLRNYITAIPSIVSTFTWTNLAILLSSVWLSDAITKKYILK